MYIPPCRAELEISDLTAYIDYTRLFYFDKLIQNVILGSNHRLVSLRLEQIDCVQRISEALNYKSVRLLLGVPHHREELVITQTWPSHAITAQNNDFFHSSVIILNNTAPGLVVEFLHNFSQRYTALNPPVFNAYPEESKAESRQECYQEANARSRLEHIGFMKSKNMHTSVI